MQQNERMRKKMMAESKKLKQMAEILIKTMSDNGLTAEEAIMTTKITKEHLIQKIKELEKKVLDTPMKKL